VDNNTVTHHHSHSHHIHRTSKPGKFDLTIWISENKNALAIIIAIIIALLSEMNWISHPIRIHLFEAAIIGYFVYIALNWSERSSNWKDLWTGSNFWMFLTLLWCIFLTVFPPSRAYGADRILRPFALLELARITFCFGIFVGACYLLKPNELRTVALSCTILGSGAALYAISLIGSPDIPGDQLTGIFGNHEQIGSFLAVLFPIALSLAINPTQNKRISYGSLALAIILGAALIVSRTRSAWLGEAVGLLPLIALSIKYAPVKITKATKFLIVGPALLLLIGFAGLACSNVVSAQLLQRLGTFQTLTDDASLSDRVHRWKSACKMAYQRPVTGYGLGAFPVIQYYWTGEGDPSSEVIKHGTGHSNIAHNYWAQWASETGVVGLTLYAAMIIAFLLHAIKSVKLIDDDFRRSLMIGCISAVTASAIDMIGAPSYNYPGVSTLPFLWMGVGMATLRYFNTQESADERAHQRITAIYFIIPLLFGIAASAIVLYVGSKR
jgi:O-antigen ligase